MKNLVLAALILAAGCARGAQTLPSSVADLPRGQAVIGLNVSGGQYQQFETHYSDDTIELTILKANDDPKWVAMASFCVRAATGGAVVCLKFHVVEHGSDEMAADKEVLSEDRKALLSRERLAGVFHVGDAIKVDMTADGNTAHFALNGAHLTDHTLPGAPGFLSLLCSTAACTMRLM